MSYYGYRQPQVNAVWWIIGICIMVFVLELVVPRVVDLLGLALIDVFFRPWTLVTNLFVHSPSDVWHIMGNMLTLYFFGTYLFGLVGEKRFLFVYFVGGVVGNIFFLLAAFLGIESPFSVAIGASGAIFAVGGVLAIMRPMLQVFIFPIPAPIPLWVAVIGGFVVMSFFPNIAWEAHLGGLLFGLAAGRYFKSREYRSRYPY